VSLKSQLNEDLETQEIPVNKRKSIPNIVKDKKKVEESEDEIEEERKTPPNKK
jgi:hypothetical protein